MSYSATRLQRTEATCLLTTFSGSVCTRVSRKYHRVATTCTIHNFSIRFIEPPRVSTVSRLIPPLTPSSLRHVTFVCRLLSPSNFIVQQGGEFVSVLPVAAIFLSGCEYICGSRNGVQGAKGRRLEQNNSVDGSK